MWKIGNDKDLLQHVTDDEREELNHRIYEKFNEVMVLELKTLPDKPTSEIEITRIIAYLQSHLGASNFTKLLKKHLDEAVKEINP